MLTFAPDDLPPIETGRYSFAPLITRSSPDKCFINSAQTQSWSCNIPYSLYYLDIQKLSDQSNATDHTISLITYDYRNNTEMPKYPWGAAPPVVAATTQLQLVIDTYEADQGPAWWARVLYNKTVIIGEDRLSAAMSRKQRRRSLAAAHGPNDRHSRLRSLLDRQKASSVVDGSEGTTRPDGTQTFDNGVHLGAVEGDKPWVCTWPNTVLEVYIYPEQPASNSHTPPLGRRRARGVEDENAHLLYELNDYPSSVAFTVPVTSTVTTASSASTTAPSSWPPFDDLPVRPDLYPTIAKLKERRVAELGSSAATCRQIEVISGGQDDKPVVDGYGQPVVVTIDELEEDDDGDMDPIVGRVNDEDDDEFEYGYEGALLGGRSPTPMVSELSDCGCLWWVF